MKSPSRVAVRYVAWLTPRAAMILLASLLVALLSGLSLLRLEFDVGLVSMLPKGSARFADYERFVERFGSRDLVVALVRGPDREETTRFASALAGALAEQSGIEKVRGRVDREALLRALGEGGLPRLLPIDRHDEIERRLGRENIADTVAGMKAALALPGSFGLSSFLIVDPLGLSGVWGEALASSRPDRALDPGQDWLASADGRRVLLLIQPQESGYGLAEVEALARTLQDAESAVRERLGSDLETRVAYTGVFAHTLEDAPPFGTRHHPLRCAGIDRGPGGFLCGLSRFAHSTLCDLPPRPDHIGRPGDGNSSSWPVEPDVVGLCRNLLRSGYRRGDSFLHALFRGARQGHRRAGGSRADADGPVLAYSSRYGDDRGRVRRHRLL